MEPGNSITTGIGPAVPTSLPAEQQSMALLSMIDESPFNPRKTFGGLTELGASLRERWLVPLIVRPHPKITGRYQLVDGARRYRAAKQAGIHAAPINLQHMSDQEVMIAQHVSYLREELPALEQAEGFKALLTSGMKVEEIAKRIGGGVSKETVYARMKLLELVEPVKKALTDGVLTAGHGILIARLEPKAQERILCQCVNGHRETMSVRELNQVIDWDIRDQQRRAERKAQPPVKRQASAPAIDWEAKRAKEAEKRERERTVRRAILEAALEDVKAPLERADFEFALDGLLAESRYDDSEAKRKAIPTMKPQRLGHLLIEIALADDIDAWDPSQKSPRLLAFAKLHKVNVDKIRARVEKELKAAAKDESPKAGKPEAAKVQPSAMKAGGK